MKRIEVRLSLSVVAPLLDVVKSVGDSLDNELAAALDLERIEEDLREEWRNELVAAQNGDVQSLLALFDSEFFSSGVVNFDESNADAILRACAAVRLRLKDQFLDDLADDALESGEVDLEALPDDQRRFFMCYLFLATVQELVIEHLEPSVS
jgi:hypothetical protein